MKADCCGDIKFNIRVMHAVDAPEQRDFMAEQMLHPYGKIHHQDDHNQFDPAGQVYKVEEAPAPGAGIRGGQNCGEWEKYRQSPQGERIDHDKDPICDPAPRFLRSRPARGQMLDAC